MFFKQTLLSLTLLFLSVNALFGKHLTGGEITYKYLGTSSGKWRYEVNIVVFRDCNEQVAFDKDITLTIWEKQGASQYSFYGSSLIKLGPVENVPITSYNPCVSPPAGICYEKTVYTKEIQLPVNQTGYVLSWERCCRNNTIVNLATPEIYGITYWATIPPQPNSSPVFESFPPTFLCLNDTFGFSHRAIDSDGDVIVYSLERPVTGASDSDPKPDTSGFPPFTLIPYSANFSQANPLGGTVPLTIDPNTGYLRAQPGRVGQFVFVVVAQEYRNGELLNELRRDWQVNVAVCPANTAPFVNTAEISPAPQNDTLLFREGVQTCYTIPIRDNVGDSVFVQGIGGIFGNDQPVVLPNATLQGAGVAKYNATMCWKPTCDQIGKVFPFYIQMRDNYKCPMPNTNQQYFWATVVTGLPDPPNLRCISYLNQNSLTLSWIIPPIPDGFVSYRIYRNDGSGWVLYDSIPNAQITTYTDIKAFGCNTKQYYYALTTVRYCNEFYESPKSRSVSNIILRTANEVTAITAYLEWSAYTAWDNPTYEVVLSNNSVASQPQDTTELLSLCEYTGNIRIRVRDPLSNCFAWSALSRSLNLHNIPPTGISICHVSVLPNNNGIEIRWNPITDPDLKEFRILRQKDHSQPFQVIEQLIDVSRTNFIDQHTFVDKYSYSYKIQAVDSCDEVVTSNVVAPILLSGSSKPYVANLEWDRGKLPWNPLEWQIFTNATSESNSFISLKTLPASDFYYTDDNLDLSKGNFLYRIMTLNPNTACGDTSWSNTVSVSFPTLVYVPSAFSPNGDGINDVFKIESLFIERFSIKIFNRLGNLVFESEMPDFLWNGQAKTGVDAPESVYVYYLELVGFDKKEVRQTGTITLIR